VSLDQVPGLTAQDRQRLQEAHNRARAQDPTLPSQPTLRRFQLPDAAHPGSPRPPAGGLRLQALTENAPLDQFSGSCGIGAYGQVAGYRLGYGQGLQNCSGATIQTVDLELMQCYWSVFGVCGQSGYITTFANAECTWDGSCWASGYFGVPWAGTFFVRLNGTACNNFGCAGDYTDSSLLTFS
jgi:hypothetical protein